MNRTNNHILLIDDEHGPMDYFVEALKDEKFEVQQIDDTDTAWKIVTGQTKISVPAVFIIDVMMPYGSHLTALETDDGLETGFHFIRACRATFPGVPVVCLTNVNHSEQIKDNLQDVPHFAKYETAPSTLASEVAKLLRS